MIGRPFSARRAAEPRWLLAALALAGATIFLALLFGQGAVLLAAGAVGGLLAAVAIVRQPLIGILILVATLQQTGWTRMTFGGGLLSLTDGLTLLTLAGVFLQRDRSGRPPRPLPEDLATRLLVLFGLAILLSLMGVVERRTGLIEAQKMIGYLLLVYLTVRVVKTTAHVRALLLALVITTVVSASVTVSDHYLHTHLGSLGRLTAPVEGGAAVRQAGTGSQAANAAKMMATGTCLAAILFLRDRRLRLLTAATAACGAAAVPTTGGRAATLILGLAFAWMLFKYRDHRRFGAALFLLPIAAAATFMLIPSYTLERLMSLTDPGQDHTTVIRLAMYTIGLDLFRMNPVLGVGPGQFEVLWTDFRYRWLPSEFPQPLHNAYLGVAVDYGLVGFVLFVAVLWVAWRGIRWAQEHAPDPELRMLSECMEFAYVLYLVQAMTGPGHRQMFMWFLVAISLAAARLARVKASEEGIVFRLGGVAALTPIRRPAGAGSG